MASPTNPRGLFATALGLLILCLSTAVFSAGVEERQLPGNVLSPYAFQAADCPSTPLLRSGRKVSPVESQYVAKRKAKADQALKAFLAKKGSFPTLKNYPMLALANAGGGVRGFLTSAGMHMAFDDKEKRKYSTSGLYQAMTYESALSGSSLMLASYVENNQPTTTSLYNSLWKGALINGLFLPRGPTGVGQALAGITQDILAKQAAGGPVSAIDALGRLFGYTSFKDDAAGPAGVDKIFSNSITNVPAYVNHEAPVPIFVSLGLEDAAQGCGLPGMNATQYEFTPFEFGSWDMDIESFTPTKYLGSTLDNGQPAGGLLVSNCVTGFDNSNFVVGTSTAILNQFCGKDGVDQVDGLLTKNGLDVIREIIDPIAGLSQVPLYSLIPNPAYNFAGSPKVSSLQDLMLVDGGENVQVIPAWPYLFRPNVDVMFISDSSTYGLGRNRTNYPNGRSITNARIQAFKQGVGNRLPPLPTVDIFLSKGLTERPVFFGCYRKPNDPAILLIYTANREYTFKSDVKTNKNKYSAKESHALLFNGAQVATGGDDAHYGFCVACAVMKRASEAENKKLPSGCGACFTKYCYRA